MPETNAPILQTIPFDIKDHILSSLEAPRDLLAFGLTSKDWGAMIIPLHTEYRELRIRANRPEIWAHLAARADLSRNIHTVRLMTPADPHEERFPTTLTGVHWSVPPPPAFVRIDPLGDMLTALPKFLALRRFTWVESGGHSMNVGPIIDAVRKCPALEEMGLGAIFPSFDEVALDSPIWKLTGLTKLVLVGYAWSRIEVAKDAMTTMLHSCTFLEELTISYKATSPPFVSCRFAHLKKLVLKFVSGASMNDDTSVNSDVLVLEFLVAHPTIEYLQWYPADQHMELPKGLLPSLKRIFGSRWLITSLLRDPTLMASRAMETISQISLGYNTMQLLGTINRSALEEVHIWHYDGLENIERLAVLFPTIRSLSIANFGMPSSRNNNNHTMEECVDCLAHFPALENLLDASMWVSIRAKSPETQERLITRLATRCPLLKRMNSWEVPQGGFDIIILRDENGNVSWKEEAVKDNWA